MNNRITTNNIINPKKIPAQKTKLNGFECWQINLHRSKAASYNLCEVTKNIGSGKTLVQDLRRRNQKQTTGMETFSR